MPRPKRICIPDLPHHAVQRGNNRHATFYRDDDYAVYLDFLGEAAIEHQVSIHAYALMTNHAHLLLTPTKPDGLSSIMQTLGRRYVTYINRTYRRSGTLWEGRFRSAVIDSDRYCLTCYRYIDLNPLRAGLVDRPADYRWCSFRSNALAYQCNLLTPHILYEQLGSTRRERAARYHELVNERLDDNSLRRIRFGTRKGLPVGRQDFKEEIEHHLGRRLGSGRVGRPSKQ
jgi:putative transposase